MITFMHKALVRAAGIALLTTTALLQLGAVSGHAAPAASQSYRASSYSLSYPSGWAPIQSGSPNTFTLFTGDRNAFVTVTVQAGTNVGGNPMPSLFTAVLGQSGTEVLQPRYGSTSVRGVQVRWASGVVRYWNNAHVGVLTIYLALSTTHTYLAALGVVDSGDGADSIGGFEYQQGQNIVNTIRFR